MTPAESLLEGLEAEKVVADKADDLRALIEVIQTRGAEAVIPPRATSKQPREFDPHVYKGCHLVERCFWRIKHFRRIATRYDKLDGRYLAFVAIISSLIYLT